MVPLSTCARSHILYTHEYTLFFSIYFCSLYMRSSLYTSFPGFLWPYLCSEGPTRGSSPPASHYGPSYAKRDETTELRSPPHHALCEEAKKIVLQSLFPRSGHRRRVGGMKTGVCDGGFALGTLMYQKNAKDTRSRRFHSISRRSFTNICTGWRHDTTSKLSCPYDTLHSDKRVSNNRYSMCSCTPTFVLDL